MVTETSPPPGENISLRKRHETTNNDESTRPTGRISSLYALFLTALFYTGLVAGRSFSAFGADEILARSAIVIYLALLGWSLLSPKNFSALFLSLLIATPYFIIFILGLLVNTNTDYGLEKLDSAITTSALCASAFAFLVHRNGPYRSIHSLLSFALIILFLTFLYKLHFGFLDRSVRFLLNGPIVFGWLMGLFFILTLNQWLHTRKLSLILLLGTFFLALLWTASKGPLLATALTSLSILALRVGLKTILVILPLALALYSIVPYLTEISGLERLGAISRILHGELAEADYGSVQTRIEMYSSSLDMIISNPLLGVGLGNWAQDASGDFRYPHNVPLELAAEIGLPLAAAFFLTYFIYAFLGGPLSLTISLYFFICQMFSGDASYLRFAIAFQIAFIVSKLLSRQSREA